MVPIGRIESLVMSRRGTTLSCSEFLFDDVRIIASVSSTTNESFCGQQFVVRLDEGSSSNASPHSVDAAVAIQLPVPVIALKGCADIFGVNWRKITVLP